jgi:hypothetical protein
MTLLLSGAVFFLAYSGHLGIKHEKGTKEHQIEAGRLKIVSKIMMTGNDIQMAIGVALLITGLSSAPGLDLYHFRMVYETASMVGPAGAAAMITQTYTVSETKHHDSLKQRMTAAWKSGRAKILYVYSALFAAYTIWFGIKLGDWDYDIKGHCYRAGVTTTPGASHPRSEIAYISVTACWMIATICFAIWGNAGRVRTVILLAAVQFPVHLYMMIAIRVANSSYLEGDENENDWEFGQTVTVLLLYLTLREAYTGIKHYYRYEKIARLEGKAQTMDLEKLTTLQRKVIEGESN